VNNISVKEKSRRLALLKKSGSHLLQTVSTIDYIPLTALFNNKDQANKDILAQIPNGAIIEIVRPNWDLEQQIGTHLNVAHLGFGIWHNSILMFRSASSRYNRVVDEPLIEYLRQMRTSPTIKGINIQIVIDPAAKIH
jgi:hypothetical protein